MSSKAPRNYTPENIEGKSVVITGGTSGIGFATAQLLLERGARVLIVGRHAGHVASALARLKPLGEAHGLSADVSKAADVGRIFAEADQQLGGLDVLVNDAGVPGKSLEEGSTEELQEILDVNVFGLIACSKEALKRFRPQKRGHIVVVGSMSAETVDEEDETYGASKAAVKAFCEAMRKGVNPHGIKVSLIEPGLVNTPMVDSSPEETAKDQAAEKIIEPEDIAECVHYVLTQPSRCAVVEVQIRPTRQAI